jgi:NCS1 family nucleobase:cation symporter-1
MSAIKRFIDIAGPAVYVVMLALAGWIVYKTGFDGISFTLASKSLTAGEQTWQMITATALVVSYFSGPLLNFGDFSRYGKSMGEIRRGNRWGLPFNFLLFSIVTVVIVSGTQSLFGRMITDPIETVSRVGNDLAVAIGLLTMITATIGINIVANFVSPAFDFSNCSPQKISFRTGGMIAAVGSILLTPWNLFNSPELIHYTLDVLGAFIGPLFGILIVDFYLIKRGQVSVDDLFDATPQGQYWYRNGFNPKAIAALIPSVAIGLVISFIPALHEVANFSWFIGVFLSGAAYRWIARDDRAPPHRALPPARLPRKSNPPLCRGAAPRHLPSGKLALILLNTLPLSGTKKVVLMIEYHTAVRGAFSISPASPTAPTISLAMRATLMMACCLSSREKFRRCCRGRRANGTCIRKQAISICAGSCYSPVLSMRTCIIRKLR